MGTLKISRGKQMVSRPTLDDPVGTVRGIFRETKVTSDEHRAEMRAEERKLEERREARR